MKMFSSFLKISVILAIVYCVYGSGRIDEKYLAGCTKFRTYANKYDSKFPITAAHRNGKNISLKFYIKTDQDASIMLFSTPDRFTNKQETYEIILSANKTRPSEIRSTGGKIVAKNFEKTYLSPDKWRPFWIRLSSDRSIEVGKEIGSSAFLFWKNDKKRMNTRKEMESLEFFSRGTEKRMPINHVGFASYDNAVVNWAFHCPENKNETVDFTECIYLNTTQYEYKAAVPISLEDDEDFYFKFYVKAKEQAHIVLSPTMKPAECDERAYEIVLGGWGNTGGGGIRTVRGSGSKISYTSSDLLSPNEWRPFWIRISPDGLVQVGKKTGSPAFMSWRSEPTEPPEIGYSVASYTSGIVDWAFECSKNQFRKGNKTETEDTLVRIKRESDLFNCP